MIDVTKSRAIEELGESLFRKVYDLLYERMNEPPEEQRGNAQEAMMATLQVPISRLDSLSAPFGN